MTNISTQPETVDEIDLNRFGVREFRFISLEAHRAAGAHGPYLPYGKDTLARTMMRYPLVKPPLSEKAQERIEARRAAAAAASAKFLAEDASDTQPAARTVANDNHPKFINPADWQGKPVPRREWYLEDLVPMRQVTILNGDGGVGKSLLALQLAAAGALQCETLGICPMHGRVMYLGAEDEADEFHRRLADIVWSHQRKLSDLGDFALLPMADADALIAVPNRSGQMEPTPLWLAFVAEARNFRPKLIVLDTAADLYGGDEIKRGQVRQFVAMLRKLAIEIDCAIILLAHPSVQGMQSGTGSSGSTGWNNSVRSRLYMTRDKDDADLRVVTTMKTNYGKVGGDFRVRWREGAFVLDDGKSLESIAVANQRAETAFKDMLALFNRTNQNVSDVTGTNYAPAKMAKHPDANGINKRQFADAMQRLLDSGEVKIVMDGPPSRQRKRLILASEDYGPEEPA